MQEWSCTSLLPGSVVVVTDHPEDLDDTVVRPTAWSARSARRGGDTGGVDDDTVLSVRPTVAPGRPGPAPALPDDTVVRTRATSAASPSAPPARPVVPPAPRATSVSGHAAGASRPLRTHSVRVGDQVHALDVPVVVGRRPSPPRVLRGAPPRLVTVASDGGVVSGSHLDVREEGDVVVVTDLRSTNGTRVAQPGRPAVQLRQGESLTVLAGTTIDLGDAVLLEILPPQRLTLKDGHQP